MFDIGCVTCRYRISEGSKTASLGDLQYITIAVQCNCVISMWKNLNLIANLYVT